MILPSITTHYSLLSGFIKPDEAAKKCAELGYTHCLLSDDNLGGVVEFVSEMKANGVVPIIGLKTPEGHYIVKTLAGYRTLIRIASGETPAYEPKDLQLYREGELDLLEVRYAEKNDAEMLRILLCSKHKTTMRKVKEIDIGDDKRFFDRDDYHFISPSGESSKNKKLISELEDYTIFCKPKLPKIHDDEAEYLTELCRAGWRKKFSHLRGEIKELYAARVKEELGVINGFGLSGYFLIVADIVEFIRKNGWLTPVGRGCFLPDSRVKMSDGLYSPISMIRVGDTVIDAYGNPQTVYDTLTHEVDEELVELEFENGKIIRCTKDHEIMTTNRGWVQADDLTEDDDIVEV